MNSRLIILTAALVLAIAAMVHLKRTAASLAAGMNPSDGTAVPSKTERIDDDHHPDRFLGLDPSLHQLAIRLEDRKISWERNRPPWQSVHTDWNAWEEFALTEARQLETAQIRALLVWLEQPGLDYFTDVWEYRQALYQVWGSKEPGAARDHVIALATRYDVLAPEQKKIWRNPYLDDVEDMYHFVMVGSARHDAAEAWKAFQRDIVNPAVSNLPNPNITTERIFEFYAAQAPEEAWALATTTTDKRDVHRMLEGYATGAAARQDWASLGAEFSQSLASRGMKAENWVYQYLATRWISENPLAALDWYASQATLYERTSPISPESSPEPLDLPEDESRERLQIDLLKDMAISHKDMTPDVIHALEELLSNDRTDLAMKAMAAITGDQLDPWDSPFLALVLKIPDPDLRHREFLRLVDALSPRDGDEFSHNNNPLPEPHITYEALRKLADTLDLPEDIRTKAEAAFQNLEHQEETARAKMRKREGSDPFAE